MAHAGHPRGDGQEPLDESLHEDAFRSDLNAGPSREPGPGEEPHGHLVPPDGLASAHELDRSRDRAADPELRLQDARDLAWRALGRRDRTVAELARMLAAKRVEPAVIEVVVAELCEQGYLDDGRFARQFAEERRRLDHWGSERIERRLRALGVDRELIAAAVADQGPTGELEAALALLRRRFPDPPATPRDCERALGVLVRKGYELELAHDALRRHAGAPALD